MGYRILLKRSADNEFLRLSRETMRRLTPRIFELSETPRPTGSKKLTGMKISIEVRYHRSYADMVVMGSSGAP